MYEQIKTYMLRKLTTSLCVRTFDGSGPIETDQSRTGSNTLRGYLHMKTKRRRLNNGKNVCTTHGLN